VDFNVWGVELKICSCSCVITSETFYKGQHFVTIKGWKFETVALSVDICSNFFDSETCLNLVCNLTQSKFLPCLTKGSSTCEWNIWLKRGTFSPHSLFCFNHFCHYSVDWMTKKISFTLHLSLQSVLFSQSWIFSVFVCEKFFINL
jgi:hypothetical protein